MTQEDKELLLKDICARLPYGIFVKENRESLNHIPTIYTFYYHPYVDNCKPYLRLMSNMTEEEKKEYNETFDYIVSARGVEINHECRPTYETYDWLNAHYFDYRGLIEKGLALEAPEGMY